MSTLNLRDLVREVIADELRPLIREQLLGELPSSLELPTGKPESRVRHHKKRKTSARLLARQGGTFWTQAEKKLLLDYMVKGHSMAECAQKLDRTIESIDGRLTHKKSGLLVDGLFGYRPEYESASDGSRRLEIDLEGNISVIKDPESGNSSAGWLSPSEFLSYFQHRL
jgi:hypothetical protein